MFDTEFSFVSLRMFQNVRRVTVNVGQGSLYLNVPGPQTVNICWFNAGAPPSTLDQH